MTFDQLSRELDRLHGLPFPPKDYQTHWFGLQGMPLDVIAAAVRAAARQCDRFPAPAELRTLADACRPPLSIFDPPEPIPLATPVIITAPFLAAPISVDREWRYYCEDCSDSGQWSLWCNQQPGSEVTRKPWMLVLACPLLNCRYPHEWVKPCPCWHTNPALVRKRQEQAQYATRRTERSR